MYYSFVYPYLIFGNIVWGKAGNTILWPIYRAQKLAIRMINNARARSRSTPYFEEMEILKLSDIHILVIGIFMHKLINNKLPQIFSNFFTENSDHHTHDTRAGSCFRPPKARLKIANNFVKKSGAILWNKLCSCPDFIIHKNVNTFKKHFKRYILKISSELKT